MSMGMMFWVLMTIWFVFGAVTYWPNSGYHLYGPVGNWFMLFILLLLLGWRVFGAPVH